MLHINGEEIIQKRPVMYQEDRRQLSAVSHQRTNDFKNERQTTHDSRLTTDFAQRKTISGEYVLKEGTKWLSVLEHTIPAEL